MDLINGDFLLWDIDPLGSTAPRFSGDSQVMSGFVRSEGNSFALLCPAQAFPPPEFKYVFNTKALID